MPRLLASAEGPQLVRRCRDCELSDVNGSDSRDSFFLGATAASDVACSDDLRASAGDSAAMERLFVQCASSAVGCANVPCTAVDVRVPGAPILLCNEAFARLAGASHAAELVGQNCRFLQCEETQQYLAEELSEAVRSRRPALVKLFNRALNSDRVFPCLVALHPVLAPNGDYLFQFGLQTDLDGPNHMVEDQLVEFELLHHLLPDTYTFTPRVSARERERERESSISCGARRARARAFSRVFSVPRFSGKKGLNLRDRLDGSSEADLARLPCAVRDDAQRSAEQSEQHPTDVSQHATTVGGLYVTRTRSASLSSLFFLFFFFQSGFFLSCLFFLPNKARRISRRRFESLATRASSLLSALFALRANRRV